jgi:inosose dehydratase
MTTCPSSARRRRSRPAWRKAKLAGFAGVELGNKFPRVASALGPILARHGLALASGWYGSRLLERDVDAEMAAAEPHIALLSALGCTVMVMPRSRAPSMATRDAAGARPVLSEPTGRCWRRA